MQEVVVQEGLRAMRDMEATYMYLGRYRKSIIGEKGTSSWEPCFVSSLSRSLTVCQSFGDLSEGPLAN